MRLNVFAKTARLFMPALFAALLLPACAAKEVEEEQGMSIAVTLRDVHRCSRISPEILVTDMPAGTEANRLVGRSSPQVLWIRNPSR